MRRRLVLPVVVLLVGGGLAGCGGNDQPAVCSSADTLRVSIGNLQDLNLSSNGIAQMQSQLATVKNDFAQVKKDAKSQFSAQVAAVNGDVDTLKSSVAAAKDSTNVTTIGAVGAALRALGTDLKALTDAIRSTC